MNKILLLLITCSSISLVGMDQEQIAPTTVSSNNAPSAPPVLMADHIAIKLAARRNRMINDAEHKQLQRDHLNSIPPAPAHTNRCISFLKQFIHITH